MKTQITDGVFKKRFTDYRIARRRDNMKAKSRILGTQLLAIGIVCCFMSGTTVIPASTEDNPNTRTIERRVGESEAAAQARHRAFALAPQRKQRAESRLNQQTGESNTDYQARLRMTIKTALSLNGPLVEKREGESEAAYKARYRAVNRMLWIRNSPLIAQPGENEEDYQGRVHASKVATDRRKHGKPPIKRAGQSEAAYQAALRAYRAQQARNPTKHVSLKGKPLPELKNLRIELPPDATPDKTILLCFLDMQQRPSRNCVLRLTKRARALKRKGVTVCVVQVSPIDRESFDEWVKKNSIPFPTGMIRSDYGEETLRDWGIQSMPWLVLTVPSHVVSAEGFGLAELSDKLGQIRRNKADSTNN